ncbi:MAG: type III-B CRISPR module-associated protein Cmr5 [bacterium]
MPIKNRTQEIANFALEKARGQKQNPEYKRYVRRLPSLLLRNGLALTLAFLKSKGGTHSEIYNHIQEWFKERRFLKENDLLKGLLETDALTYRSWSREALELATWLHRMAEAEIEEGEG